MSLEGKFRGLKQGRIICCNWLRILCFELINDAIANRKKDIAFLPCFLILIGRSLANSTPNFIKFAVTNDIILTRVMDKKMRDFAITHCKISS